MRPFPRPTLTAKVTFLVASGILAAVICCAVLFAQMRHLDMRAAGEDRLRLAMSAAGGLLGGREHAAGRGIVLEDFPWPESTVADAAGRFGDVRIAVFLRDAQSGAFALVASYGRTMAGQPVEFQPQGRAFSDLASGKTDTGAVLSSDETRLVMFVPLIDPGGAIIGAVGGVVPHLAFSVALWDVLPRLLLPGLCVLTIAAMAGRAMVRRALRPVDKATRFLDGVARGETAADRVRPDATGDFAGLLHACGGVHDALVCAALQRESTAESQMERERDRAALARVFEVMRAGLDRLADGDLVQPIPEGLETRFPPAQEGLRQSFDRVVDGIRNMTRRVGQLAGGLHDSAGEMTVASRELSARAETQAATLEESAAALTELTQSVASTAERAGKAQEASSANQTGAERGAQIVRDAVAAMQEIERGSEQITRIIAVIDDIAFQTNLLALNAGVEAVRAGEAGRGFAVVASEVRLLAQRASASAREIKGLISMSTRQVAQGSALVRKAGESLGDIVLRANEAAGLVADIAHAAAEQARGLSEVASAINQLDQVTQQNSAVAEETSAAAATLQSRSEEIIRALGYFRMGQCAERAIVVPDLPDAGAKVVEARIVDWAPAVKAATNARKANRTPPNAVWAEF